MKRYTPASQWNKAERCVNPNGYILVRIPRHPKAFRGGWYYEHRLVAERELGRVLRSWETVHHISEVKTDNRWCNLFVCTRTEHDYAQRPSKAA